MAEQFALFLRKNGVPDPLCEFMVAARPEGLGLASIADYGSYFTEKSYEDGLKTAVLEKIEAFKSDFLALARLRTAWKLARSEVDKACKERVEGQPSTDWDTPLSDDQETARKAEVDNAYDHISFESEDVPMATITGRYFREFRSSQRHVSLTNLTRVRSEAEFKGQSMAKKTDLPGGLSISYEAVAALPDLVFTRPLLLLNALRLLTIAWALAGACLVDSKSDWDPEAQRYRRVRQCHLGTALWYHSFAAKKAAGFVGSDSACVAWLMDRDRQTRAKAKALFASGWPWGEAIVASATSHCLVLWQLSSGSQGTHLQLGDASMQVDSDGTGGRPIKKPKKEPKEPAKPKNPCPDFNSAKGCKKKAKQCPHKLKHVCSKCGHWSHGFHKCQK